MRFVAAGDQTHNETAVQFIHQGVDPWVRLIFLVRHHPGYGTPRSLPSMMSQGTVIDTHYQSKGVTFATVTNSKHRPPTWHSEPAYARQTPNAESRPNVVSVEKSGGAAFDARSGGVQAKFAAPQLYVSIDGQAVPTLEFVTAPINKPFIQAFDALGKFSILRFIPPIMAILRMGVGNP